MKVAVLGSNGFLGKYICENLSHDVIPINRSNLNLNDFVSVATWLEKNKPDVIVNCATSGGKTQLGSFNFDDIKNNLGLFLNFYNNSDLIKKFINIGSGAEFDITKNIDSVKEETIVTVSPEDSYGYSKNIISRLVLNKDNFYTLRLFGCFDSSEPEFRLFKKFLSNTDFKLMDRKFDYISAKDFLKVLDYYVVQKNLPKDINCVYQEKLYLSEILDKFDKQYNIVQSNILNYTGDGSKLASLNVKLEGLDLGIKEYKSKI